MRIKTAQLGTAAILALSLTFAGCEVPTDQPTAQRIEVAYSDGIYRGFYNDGGIEQFCVEFTLSDGCFKSVSLSEINYKDGDYLDEDATRIQTQVASQYTEAADYLIGKPVSAVEELLDSTAVSTDRDTVTSATLRTGKLVSAIGDGLKRGVFLLTGTAIPSLPDTAPDGGYKGFYYEEAMDMVAVYFELKDDVFVSVELSSSGDDTLKGYCMGCADNLKGQPISALSMLYAPATLPFGVSVTIEEAGMVRSAFMDALARGVFKRCPTTVLNELSGYKNGVYRGFYSEGGIEQVSVQFELVNDTFVSLRYRALSYADGNYMSERATDRQTGIYHQYLELSEYLVGRPVSCVYDLFDPGELADDTDSCSGATLPTSQLISALVDGLDRGVYRLGEID